MSNLVSTFDSASALSSCNKGAIYRLWGATLRAVYPAWSSESSACLIDTNIGTAATAWVTDPTTAATTYGNIADWDTSAVSSMFSLFYGKPTFNADISKWNVASVSNMRGMFNGATAFNVNIGAWNTARAGDLQSMFQSAAAFNGNIGKWNTASAVCMVWTFYQATAFNQDIGAWNTARTTTMSEMFYKATAFNQDISTWNVASVTVFTGGSGWGMFNGATAFNQNIARWNVLRVTSLTSNFDSAGALSSCNKGAIYLAWGTTLRTAYPTFLASASISSFSPLNTQVSGAATVTVLGANFQCSDLSPSAYISGKPCATTAWTTSTQLVCAAPAPVLVGAGRQAWVRVFTNTASRSFTFDGTISVALSRFGP